MLIDTGLTIAYKCPFCGSFEFFSSSLFKMLCKKENYLACRCGRSGIIIKSGKACAYKFTIPCMACGGDHTYTLNKKEMISGTLQVFSCPKTAIHQCFIGSDPEVRRRIDILEKEFDELISTFGYDDYFINTQVMIDVINKIHDVAEQGNLCCECGSHDVELAMLPDSVRLQCRRCSGQCMIRAASNQDLKHISKRQHIYLGANYGDIQVDKKFL